MNAKEKLQQLKDAGHTVWSHSRLGSFHNCNYEYYQTYVLRQPRKGNCYTDAGSFAHDKIESVYKNEYNKDLFAEDFENKLVEMELKGLKFPSDDIRRNFTKDVLHYANNFKLLDGKHLLEKLIVFDIDGHYLQGYIDMINVVDTPNGKEVNVVDWKTSSKFAGSKKLQEAGRQLLMYKVGLETTSKAKINSLSWCMLKYVTVNYLKSEEVINKRKCKIDGWVKTIRKSLLKLLLDNGIVETEANELLDISVKENNLDNLPDYIRNTYWLEDLEVDGDVSNTHLNVCNIKSPKKYGSKMCSRRKWVLDMRPNFEKDMLANGLDDMEIDILLDDAVSKNDISNLPDFITNKYWIEDCYVEYEATEEKIQELKDYVKNTIAEIESKDKENEDDWKPLNFDTDSFYCNHLCNHRSTCKFLAEYKKGLNLQSSNSTFVDLDDIL